MKESIDLKTPIFQLTVEQFLSLLADRKKDDQNKDRIIFIDEVVALTGLKKCSIYQRTSKNSIPHWRRGKRLYFSYNAIIDWLKENA